MMVFGTYGNHPSKGETKMKDVLLGIFLVFLGGIFAVGPACGQQSNETAVLFKNANIFDGRNEKLAEGMSVLIKSNMIAKIAETIEAPVGAIIIDARGRVLMPGLIDAHWHTYYANAPVSVLATGRHV